MKLERKWARFVLGMLALGAGSLLLSLLIRPDFVFDRYGAVYLDGTVRVLKDLLGTVGLTALVTAAFHGRRRLRCPHCGKGFALPRWRPGKRRYCAHCGKPFVFDDEGETN